MYVSSVSGAEPTNDPVPEGLRIELGRLVRAEQAARRLPSVTAAVVRDGEIIWREAVGLASIGGDRAATVDTQYRLGSITRTFTAVAGMQLRDAGELDLDDQLDKHITGAAHALTIRRLLSHLSGIQREVPGAAWETHRFEPSEKLLDALAAADRVLPPGRRWHYSNLAFAVLGQLIEQLAGMRYEQYLHERILGPLGIQRISLEPQEPAVEGYLVQPYADGVWTEAPVHTAGCAPAGQLWGTVEGLCRWGAFLVEPNASVLAGESLDEMRTVQAIVDDDRWTVGYGLGLGLRRDADRVLVGHSGGMPGFAAELLVSPNDMVGAAVLTNSGGSSLVEVTERLIARTVEQLPVAPEAWHVAEPPPPDLKGVLGVWFIEGEAVVFRWRKGVLEAGFPDAPEWVKPSLFRKEDVDLYRAVSGPEHGERLRFVRDETGRVTKVYWATYPVTREPRVWGGDG